MKRLNRDFKYDEWAGYKNCTLKWITPSYYWTLHLKTLWKVYKTKGKVYLWYYDKGHRHVSSNKLIF